MKRFHLNLKVSNLEQSTTFYSKLFAANPTVQKEDYVKWMLDDPFINFSIEPAEAATGIAHVGIEAENEKELAKIFDRVGDAGGPAFAEGQTTCCYAESEKTWTRDPDGLIWETFYTDGQVAHYGKTPDLAAAALQQSCCMPAPKKAMPAVERCC